MSYLTNGIHYYSSHKYDDALKCFLSLPLEGRTPEEIAEIQTWTGRCYFEKRNLQEMHSECTSLATRRFEEGLRGNPTTVKRMSDIALSYFDEALSRNPKSSVTYYWKGKVLENDRKIERAYQSFIFAASLDYKNREYREKCCELFDAYPMLVFLETTPLSSIDSESFKRLCSSSYSYDRVEACEAVLIRKDSFRNAIREIKRFAGSRFFCCYFPYGGDRDERVRNKARSILA